MTTFEKLQIKIKKDLNLDCYNFKREYASIQELGMGAFSWSADHSAGTIGSGVSATELLKIKTLNIIESPVYSSTKEIV